MDEKYYDVYEGNLGCIPLEFSGVGYAMGSYRWVFGITYKSHPKNTLIISILKFWKVLHVNLY